MIQTNENLNRDSIALTGILKSVWRIYPITVQSQLLELIAMNANNTKT